MCEYGFVEPITAGTWGTGSRGLTTANDTGSCEAWRFTISRDIERGAPKVYVTTSSWS